MKNLLWMTLLALLTLAAPPSFAAPDYSTPESLLKTYLSACQAGDVAAANECYTASSRAFIAAHPEVMAGVNPELLTATYDRLSALKFETEQISPTRAILKPSDSKVPPFYLRQQKAGEGWRIDWHFMSNYIRADDKGWRVTNIKAESVWRKRP